MIPYRPSRCLKTPELKMYKWVATSQDYRHTVITMGGMGGGTRRKQAQKRPIIRKQMKKNGQNCQVYYITIPSRKKWLKITNIIYIFF